jgi:hypothetical protein
MKKKFALLSLVLITIIVTLSFSSVSPDDQSLTCLACGGCGVVDKTAYETFTVKITFQHTGKTEGTWSVNIDFEGEA